MSSATFIDDDDVTVTYGGMPHSALDSDPVSKFRMERLTGIGGSDAAAVLGLSVYKTPFELYLEKTGAIEPLDLSDNAAVTWGTKLESVVADHFAEVTGYKVRRDNRLLRHPEYPFVIAHIDRRIVGSDAILEVKTAGAFAASDFGDEGTDQVPESYLLQGMHYLAVTGKSECHFAVLVGGRDFRQYVVVRDDDLIASMLEADCEFWIDHVQAGIAPPMEFTHPKSLDLVKRLYTGTNGQVVELGDELIPVHERFVAVKKLIGDAETERDALKAQLLAAVGENAAGKFACGFGYTRTQRAATSYAVDKKAYIDFRFAKAVK
jgi:putative phage-type endonuclease